MWYSQFWSSVVGFGWVSIEGGARRGPSSGCRDPSSSRPGIPSTVFQYQYEESPVGILMTWAKVEFSGVGTNGVSVPVTRVLIGLPSCFWARNRSRNREPEHAEGRVSRARLD